MRISIRSSLLMLVLAVLLPAVAASLLAIVHIERSERDALRRNLRDTSRALSLVLDGKLSERVTLARTLALSSLLDGGAAIAPAELARFEQLARDATWQLAGWVELRSQAGVLMNTRLPVDGRPSTPPSAADGAAALLTAPAVGGVASRIEGEQPLVSVTQPTLRQGQAVLNLTVTLLPAELQQIIDRQQLPPGWIGTVIDQRGLVVARWPGGAQYVGRPVTGELQALMSAHDEGLFESVSLDGTAVTGYFSKSPQHWTYVAAMPRAQAVLGVPTRLLQLVAGALLLLFCAIGGALWTAGRIVGPVRALKDAAARIQAGAAVSIRPTGIREFDDVAATLAEAAASAQRAQQQLAARVAEAVSRTRLAEQAMSQRQRVEALGRLTGGIAHDFNNLLGVISNSAHLMQRRYPGPDLKAPLAATLRAVDVGSRLTRHLRRFAGQQPGRRQQVDLTHALPETQELLAIVLGKRIELAIAVAPRTLPVHVDPGELELALINLALNARDALPTGGHVWLGARNATAEDTAGLPSAEHVLITFSDDGMGIDESIANRVFEPFFTTKTTAHGTGLGLSQVHGFCEQSGGRSGIGSTPGLGTTVSLLLPAAAVSPVADQPGVAASGPQQSQMQSLPMHQRMAGVRMLLVEDNAELADATAVLLRAEGCTVTTVEGPEQALMQADAADAADFDIVLSDVLMPGPVDGLALARELRVRHPALPVVLISGHSSALTSAHGFPVLHKPCPPDELIATLLAAVDASRRRIPSATA